MNLKEVQAIHQEAIKRKDLSKIAELAEYYNNVLNSEPDNIGVLFLVGTCHLQLGHNGLAINVFKRVLEKNPAIPECWNNLGTAWKGEHNNNEAEACFLEAAKLKEDADFYNNLSTLYVNEGDPAPGLGYAERAIELNFNHAQAHWNKALLLLEQGKHEQGFLEYEFGLLCNERPIALYNPALPMWEGQKNKRVIVYGEQGIGDEILFASCIPDLIRDSKEVIIDGHPRLVDIYKQSFSDLKVMGTRKQTGIRKLDFKADCMLPMGSLLRYYRSSGKWPRTPYLKADPDLVAHYRAKVAELGPGPYIGIGWKGGAKKTRVDIRSTKLKEWLPVLKQDATFVSLQYTPEAKDKIERLNKEHGTALHFLEAAQEHDYHHTAALISALDLVVSVNTAAVHLAGALGKDCWTLTPRKKAWRYFDPGDGRMLTYGSVLMVQNKEDSWANVMERIAADLKGLIAKREAA